MRRSPPLDPRTRIADHRHDQRALSAWLANKTPETVRAWITDGASFNVVAVDDERVCGFGRIIRGGTIELCYVAPEVQHRGVGQRVLRALEAHAADEGVRTVTLTSSGTARAFYRGNGYVPNGNPVAAFGRMRGYPMTKTLPSSPA